MTATAHEAERNLERVFDWIRICKDYKKIENMSYIRVGSSDYISSNLQFIRGIEFHIIIQ
jgi:hypothetical protein